MALIGVLDYHGATPPAHWNRSQDPLPFRAHSPIHPILIPDYGTLEERYFRILRQDETLPTPKVRASQLKYFNGLYPLGIAIATLYSLYI